MPQTGRRGRRQERATTVVESSRHNLANFVTSPTKPGDKCLFSYRPSRHGYLHCLDSRARRATVRCSSEASAAGGARGRSRQAPDSGHTRKQMPNWDHEGVPMASVSNRSAWQQSRGSLFAPRRPSRNMFQSSNRYRLAVAALDTSQQLWSALDDLVVEGFAGAQLCVLSSRSALDAIAPPHGCCKTDRDELVRLFETLAAFQPGDEGGRTDARSAAPLDASFASRSAAETHLDAEGRTLLRRHLENFRTEIEGGAFVLLVSSGNVEQHAQSSKVLLKHSSSRVRVCEFTRNSST